MIWVSLGNYNMKIFIDPVYIIFYYDSSFKQK